MPLSLDRGGCHIVYNIRELPLVNLDAEQFTELVELEGRIANVDMSAEVLIDTNDGQIILEGRALSFAITQDFTAQIGNDVLVEGFYEDADFEIVQITNQTNGLVTVLRDECQTDCCDKCCQSIFVYG